MSALPAAYADLAKEPAPLMLLEALKLHGVLEKSGPGSNPTIVKWADEVETTLSTPYTRWAADWYNDDQIPWCGLFMAVVAVRASQGRADRMPPPKYLSARDWLNFGKAVPIKEAMLGDVAVFDRQGGAHVAMVVGEDGTHLHVLGGNQSQRVNIARKAKFDCIGIRRPIYKQQPANVRKIVRAAKGPVSGKDDGA
jgi:uncharacterized protein (TIGR02594 family)